MDYIQLHANGQPIPLNQRVAGRTFPPLLEGIVDRALAKRPEDRFASAEQFAEALRSISSAPSSSVPEPASPTARTAAAVAPARSSPVLAAPAVMPPTRVDPPPPSRAASSPQPSASSAVTVPTHGSPAAPRRPALAKNRSSTLPGGQMALLIVVALVFLALGVLLAMLVMRAARP